MRSFRFPFATALVIAVNLVCSFSPGYAATVAGGPSRADRQAFHEKMMGIALPGAGIGCFSAKYGDPHWHKMKCHAPTKIVNPRARGPKPFFVGAGTDYFSAPPGGYISSATGSFDSVTNVTAESSQTYNSGNVAHTNVYSLQLNANDFTTTACTGSVNCKGWEQFLYSQSQCNGACIFIEYWLLNHNSSCPAGQGWNYYPGTPQTIPGCYLNTAYASVPVQALADLGGLRLVGKVAGNVDTVSVSTASGNVYAASNPSIAQLGAGWTSAEYNLVGDCCSLGAYFTAGPATLNVRLSTVNGTPNAPNCTLGGSGATAETNNLDLIGSCVSTGGAQPSIAFTESGGGPLPPGITQGDTHLTTINGTRYDLQTAGFYTLIQTGSDLIVQSRQGFLGSHDVSWNLGLAVQIGKNLITLSPAGALTVNLEDKTLADGSTLSLDDGVTITRHGGLFTIARPQGSTIQANTFGNHIDATVRLGPTESGQAQGLLSGRNGALIAHDGSLLRGPITTKVLEDFAEGWRVEARKSIFPAKEQSLDMVANGYAKGLASVTDGDRKKARDACSRVGVKNAILLNDCILDVAVTGDGSLADAYVYAPIPKRKAKVGAP